MIADLLKSMTRAAAGLSRLFSVSNGAPPGSVISFLHRIFTHIGHQPSVSGKSQGCEFEQSRFETFRNGNDLVRFNFFKVLIEYHV